MAEISCLHHRFPLVIIQHAVWLRLRSTLSYRGVEEESIYFRQKLSFSIPDFLRSWSGRSKIFGRTRGYKAGGNQLVRHRELSVRSSSRPAAAGPGTRRIKEQRHASLVRQARYYIERPQNLARLGLAAEGVPEDRNYLAGTIDVAEGAVHGETKVGVAAGQCQRIGLDGQIVVGQPKLVGCFAVLDQKQQDRPVGEVGRNLALIQHRETLIMGLDRDDVADNPGVLQRVAQRLLGRRAGKYPDLLAG